MLAGFVKVSYIDYPGELASVLFTRGCNFRCPWCHNQGIVKNKNSDELDIAIVIGELVNNKHLVNHVVVTGGEPTLHGNDLALLLRKLKELGFKVKLDTNGTNPKLLAQIIDEGIIDYIAMDLKNTFAKYDTTVEVKVDIQDIKESINLIENSKIPYQFRTTINKLMHTAEDLAEMKSYLKKPEELKLQKYRYSKEQIVDRDFGVLELV